MLAVRVLVLKQMAAVLAVIAVFMGVVRLWGLGVYQDTRIVLWAVLGVLALFPISGWWNPSGVARSRSWG